MKRLSNDFLSCLVLAALFSAVPALAGDVQKSAGQTLYVPVYSHIYGGNKERPFNLAVTLSIRNTDMKGVITVVSVDYFDTKGVMVKEYLDREVRLGPLETLRYVVRESDTSGGSGANFIVRWHADTEVNLPLVESVMIGTQSQQGISFTSRGQAISD